MPDFLLFDFFIIFFLISSTEDEESETLLVNSESYHWKALLEFYATFVRQIESGQRSWGDSSVDLEVPILSKHDSLTNILVL
jgi:hypothetical protein